MEFNFDFQGLIATLIAAVVPVVAAWIGKHVNGWLDANKEKVLAGIDNEYVKGLVDMAWETTVDVVDFFNVTIVNQLKKASEDGHLSKEEIALIQEDSLNKIKEMIGTDAQEALKAVYGDVDKILKMWTEIAVGEAKGNSHSGIDTEVTPTPVIKVPEPVLTLEV